MLASNGLVRSPDCLNLFVDGHSFPRLPGKTTLSLPANSSAAMAMWFKKSNRSRRNRLMVVKSGYTKRPMDTPGAYELIDEHSGEKVIVWGGAGDENSPVPSKKVISWDPRKESKDSIGGAKHQTVARNGDDHGAKSKGSSRTFGRLKVHKVRKLVRKASHGRKEVGVHEVEESEREGIDDDDDDDDESQYTSSDSEDESIGTRERVTVKQGIDQRRQKINESKKPFDSDRYSSRSTSSASALRSKGWNRVEPTDHVRDYGSRDSTKDRWKHSGNSDFFSRKTFKELGYNADMIECLRNQDFTRPSHIQAMAFETVSGGKSSIVADQSGSGKTLAYLAPIVQRLRQEELQGLSKSLPGSPRAVILVPTAELASQVLANCRSLSKSGMPFRSMVATGGFRQKTQLESLEQELDVLIATPGRFIYLLQEGFLHLTNLQCAVLDEVDILFGDEDFQAALQSLITKSPVTTQYVFVTATLPLEIYNKLVEIFPDCAVVMGPSMHRTSSGLEEVLVDCSGDDGAEKTPETAFSNKKTALLRLMEESPVAKTIVFCNKIETCRKVENMLKRSDRKENQVKVLPFHAALDQEKRLANLKHFLVSRPEKESLFLICTDRASRGIDFAGVDHVVLFDFPRDPSEYVRRVGRTARGAGGEGKAFAFVVGKQVSLARRIMDRNSKGHPLHEVPSSYELMR